MKNLFYRKTLYPAAIAICVALTSFPAFSQSNADRFFQQIYAQQPQSWFPLNEENMGRYEETYANGFTTRQSFLRVDAYGSGNDRYLVTLEAEELEEFLPGVSFFLGELTCSHEFNGGKLPFIGFSGPKKAGFCVPSSYDVFNVGFMELLGGPELGKQGQQEKYAEALVKLLARLRLRQENCEDQVIGFSKARTKWMGGTLNVKQGFELKCKLGESVEWGPKPFLMDFDFEFNNGRLTGITAMAWP